MTAIELIEALQKGPPDAEVSYFWDSAARTTVQVVYVSMSGQIVLSDGDELKCCFHPQDEPQTYLKEIDHAV